MLDETEDNITKLLIKLDKSIGKERDIIKLQLEKLRNTLKNTKKETNIKLLYPEYEDEDFNKRLLNKKEYAQYNMDTNIENKQNYFQLSNNQRFLKKLIHPQTPFRTIYLFHGVGVGKTCASIQMAINFREYYHKKVLVLLPSRLIGNYIKELFNIAKWYKSDDTMEQCIGNYYLKRIKTPEKNQMSDVEIEKKIKKLIKGDFEFIGFMEFVNVIERIEKESINKKLYVHNLRKKFDNRVIITDEIHNLRTQTDKEGSKKAPKVFHHVLEHLNNTTLIMLSATPMYNDYKEIKFILNTILIHNKKKKMTMPIYIENELNPEFKELLVNISTRFISYMRGDNPYTFPVRLYPSINREKMILTYEDYPKNDMYGEPILPENQIRFLEILGTHMSSLQNKIYNKTKIIREQDEDDENNADLQSKIQISNIVYPNNLILRNGELIEKFDLKAAYGRTGFYNIFSRNAGEKMYKTQYKNMEYGEFLSYPLVKQYSPKIHLLIKNLTKSNGICLVYSRYLESGIIPIALALEHAGMNKWGGNNLFKTIKYREDRLQGNYIIISSMSNKRLSPNNDQEISIMNQQNNKYGKKIKIALMTESGTEGLDFRNIREIHIIEPWYNLNRIEQIIGRGVRNKSHFDLPPMERNTTIFNYVNLTKRNNYESIDYRMYRMAENKQRRISTIEKIIKNNSIDCQLNKDDRIYKDIKIMLKTSHNIIKNNYDIGDTDYTKICDYDVCKFTCDNEIKIDYKKLDDSTFNKDILSYDIKNIQKQIMNWFSMNSKITMDELLNTMNTQYPELIYLAVNDMMNKRIVFKGINKRTGYVIMRNNYLMFQPKSIKDEKITSAERYNPRVSIPFSLDISFLDVQTRKKDKDAISLNIDISTEKNINNIIEYTIDYYVKEMHLSVMEMNKNMMYVYDMFIDHLSKQNVELLYTAIFNNWLNDAHRENIIESLNRVNAIEWENNEIVSIYNPYIDHFICYENNEYIVCSSIQENPYMERFIEQNKTITELNVQSLTIFGYMEIKDDEAHNKIKDLYKLMKGINPKGSVCFQTSTFTIERMIEYINILNPKFVKEIKYTKVSLCLLYELLLRTMTDYNNRNNIRFIRTMLYNIIQKQ